MGILGPCCKAIPASLNWDFAILSGKWREGVRKLNREIFCLFWYGSAEAIVFDQRILNS
jgi:hypothetical protein